MDKKEFEQQIYDTNKSVREVLTFAIPLSELLQCTQDISVALVEFTRKTLKTLKGFDLASNAVESMEISKITNSNRRGIVHFISNTVGGTVVVVGIIGGATTAQPEIVALTIVITDEAPKNIEQFVNICIDFLDDNILDPLQEKIESLWNTIKSYPHKLKKAVELLIKNKLFESGIYNNYNPNNYRDKLEFLYYNVTDYSLSSNQDQIQFANNAYDSNTIKVASQGYMKVASDIPLNNVNVTHNIKNLETQIHAILQYYQNTLDSIKEDYLNFKPIIVTNKQKDKLYIQRISQEESNNTTTNQTSNNTAFTTQSNTNNQIRIQANDMLGRPIANLKQTICLDIEYDSNMIQTIYCSQELDNGIYVFDIPNDISIFARVFVQLSRATTALQQIGNQCKYITYNAQPHFLHSTCSQINLLGVMLYNDKYVPYAFDTTDDTPLIGMIKAYKLPNIEDSCDHINIFDNTLQHYKNHWNNEIYTIDLEQTIRLQAFVSNNLTDKTIKENLTNMDLSQIKWGYIISNGELKTKLDSNIDKKHIKHFKTTKQGTNITLNLKNDVEEPYIPYQQSNPTNSNNIIIFAYNEKNDEKITNLHYKTTNNNRVKTIQCIELKILQTRFYLRYDGLKLTLLENERVIDCINDNNNEEIAGLLHNLASKQQTTQDSNSKILDDGIYILQPSKTLMDEFYTLSSNASDKNIKEGFKRWNNVYKNILIYKENAQEDSRPLNKIELVVLRNKEITIEIHRYYEDIHKTASIFRILIDNNDNPTCNKHKGETNDAILQSCNECKTLKDFAKFDNHYFIERSGPDCITPDLELRIPEGTYEVDWHKSDKYLTPNTQYTNKLQDYRKELNIKNEPHGKRYWKPLLNLHNQYVHKDRNILIHSGGKVDDSKGCLLVGEQIDEDNGNITRITKQKTFDIASNIMSFLMDYDTTIQIDKQGKKIEKKRHLLANGKKIQIPNVNIVIKNRFGEINESNKMEPNIKSIWITQKYSQYNDINNKKTSGIETYFIIKTKPNVKIKKVEFSRDNIKALELFQQKDNKILDNDTLKEILNNNANDKNPIELYTPTYRSTDNTEFRYDIIGENGNSKNNENVIAFFVCDNNDNINFENYIQLGFEAIDVAKYIVDEIKRNVNSKEAREMKALTAIDNAILDNSIIRNIMKIISFHPVGRAVALVSVFGSRAGAYCEFIYKVAKKQEWDHKWQIESLFPTMGLSTKSHHRYMYNNKIYEIFYDVWSNIHYGFIGKVIGFSEWELLLGASVAHINDNSKSDNDSKNQKTTKLGDDPKDQVAIKLGFELYEIYKNNINGLTENILMYFVMENKSKLNINEV